MPPSHLASGREDESSAVHFNTEPSSMAEVRALVHVEDLPVLFALAVSAGPATVNTLAFLVEKVSVLAAGERLVSLGLLEWQEGRALPEKLAFCSTDVARIVYNAVPRQSRVRIHTRAAERSSGVDRLRHLVGASEGDDPQLADELDDAAEAERYSDEARAAHYLLWASRLGGSAELAGRRLCEGVRLLVIAAYESEAGEHRDDVRALAPSATRSETLAMLDFAESKVLAAQSHLMEAREQARSSADHELRARINLELAYANATIGLGKETVEAASQTLALSSDSRSLAVARAFLAAGHALRSGPIAGLECLAQLPTDPNECLSEQMPQLVQRGILLGLLGRLVEAARDLSVVIRRDDQRDGRLLGMAPYVHLAWIQYMLGRWGEGRITLDAAFSLLSTQGRSFDGSVLFAMSAIFFAGQGEYEAAKEALVQADKRAAAADYIGPMILLTIAKAALAQSRADFGEMGILLDRIGSSSAAIERTRLYSPAWLPGEAGADIVLRRYQHARVSLARLRDLPSDGTWLVLAGYWLDARLAEAEGRNEAAAENYAKGLNMSSVGGDPLWYRALLLHSYGHFCLHHGSRASARSALKAAAALFKRMGAVPFLQRCRDDLTVLDSTSDGGWAANLTAREQEIGLLVARGWTNPEIARELFISTKTVEYHLRNTYMKLDMTNRRELRDAVHATQL